MKMNSTKSKLMASMLVLVLCVTAFFGSTYAWFTDSVTSAGNKIVAGNLDIDLYMWVDGQYEEITDASEPIFGEGSIAQNNNAETLWEPGKTQVAYFKLKNAGTLDLKYLVNVKAQNPENGKDLYKVMQYQVTPDAQPSDVDAWDASAAKNVVIGTQPGTAGDVAMTAGAEHYFALAIHMDENAGNEYQGGQVIFDIEVLATQKNAEVDSFGPDYDELAEYINGAYVAPAVNKTVTGTPNNTFTEKMNEVLTVSGTYGDSGSATVKFEPSTAHTGTVIESNEAVISYDIEVTGHNGEVTVTIFVGKGLSDVKVYHDGQKMTEGYSYNSATGIIEITTATFSIFDITFDAPSVVTTKEGAQEALDNAKPGDVIRLASGVNYGTLYLRPTKGNVNTVTDCDYLVYRNEMLRKVENLTIVGAPGATIDAIKVEAGYVENSGSTGYVVDIKNLVIDSVTFTDDYVNPNTAHKYSAPLFFDLTYTNVDGLTVKNCNLVGNNDKMNFVYFYGSGNPSNSTFETAAKNITITNNTVDGIARLCELRQAENVTITNNTIKNTALHGALLAVDKGTFSGNVTITGNTADGIHERFVRMAGAGEAVVVIKDNIINNYKGADDDYIKVTDGSNVTIENNTLSFVAKDVASLSKAVAAGGTVILGADITVADTVQVTSGSNVTINLNGFDLSYAVGNSGASALIDNRGTLEIKGEGTIGFVAENPDLGTIPSYATNTITNEGTLTIGKGVTVTNGSDGGASYAVDNKGVFTLDGGTLIGNRCALRVAKYNQDNVEFVMNSGTVEAATPAWIQLPGSDANVAPTITVEINGGTFKTTNESSADNDLLYTYSFGNSHANTNITINGGEFLGGTVSIGSGYYGDAPNLTINGGTFDYDVLRWSENGESSKVVYTAEQLQEAFNNGGNVTLGNDIDLNDLVNMFG